jgi:hypothetical protein
MRTLAVASAVAVLAAVGCSRSLEAPDGGGIAGDTGVASDPAACNCKLDGYTLTMSWDCFCKAFDCTKKSAMCEGGGLQEQWIKGCGLSQYSIETVGGPFRWVYDGSGNLVGEQASSDVSEYHCPSAPEIASTTVRAGQFPDACNSSTVCACSPDGGSCDPTDAARF